MCINIVFLDNYIFIMELIIYIIIYKKLSFIIKKLKYIYFVKCLLIALIDSSISRGILYESVSPMLLKVTLK